MGAWDPARRADVVILTAIRQEFDAVLDVEAGAAPGSAWELGVGPTGLPVAHSLFMSEGGAPLRVTAAVSPEMGATAAVNTLLPLVDGLQPRCVAMCGVCAGRRGKTHLGDVVAAERLFYSDTGKQRQGEVQHDLTTYKLRDDWKTLLEGLDAVAQFRDAKWFQRRPLTTEWREHRALVALRDGVAEPWTAVEPGLGPEAWQRILKSLRERGLLAGSGRALTERGRQVAEDLLFEHQGALPDLSATGVFQPFRLHVAPMGSGSRVIEDESIWNVVSRTMRKTLAVEMESAVLGELAHRQRHRGFDAVVMKGVMDFADQGRDDQFKEFAARASAECLLWFLRKALSTQPADCAGTSDRPARESSARHMSTSRAMTKHTILFLAANPTGNPGAALDLQARAVQVELERSGFRDCFEFEARFAATSLDLLRELRKLRPSVVHFTGVGNENGVYFEGESGGAQLVSGAALAEAFGAAGDSVHLVVLSACYSESQAEALLAHVDCVVCVSGEIGAVSARNFAIGFYGGLGERASVEAAFKHGRAAIGLGGSTHGAHLQLKVRSGIDASRLVLADAR